MICVLFPLFIYAPFGRHIKRRIPVEEIKGHQFKFVPDGWHDREIFCSWDVMESGGIPKDDVRVLDGAIRRSPSRKSESSLTLIYIHARSVSLVRHLRRHPQLMLCESGTLLCHVAVIQQAVSNTIPRA